jgi:hypothetical protein
LDPGKCFRDLEGFNDLLRNRSLFGNGNFEYDCYVGQIKDEYFIVTVEILLK